MPETALWSSLDPAPVQALLTTLSWRRARTTVNGKTVVSQYDVADRARDVSEGTEFSYLGGMGLDEPLVMGTSEFFLADGLGSIIAVANSAGAITGTLEYDPFGRTSYLGTAAVTPFRFTGREDDTTGLYYYRARYCSPSLTRFISEDPLGLDAGLTPHLYAYVGNSPLSFIDPLGLIRLPYRDLVNLVAANNRSGFSNALISCVAWNESSHDPARKHASKTETGLMAVTADAAKEVDFNHDEVKRSNTVNIQAGSGYLKNRVGLSAEKHPNWTPAQNLRRGLQLYGTGARYPVDKLLECEECIQALPAPVAAEKCPPQESADPQACLNKIHN